MRLKDTKKENDKCLQKASKDYDRFISSNKDNREQHDTLADDLRRAEHQYHKLLKQKESMAKKAAQAKQKYEDCVRERAWKQREYNEKCKEQEKTARMVEDLKKEIESKMRERKLLGKDVVDAQDKERVKKDELQTKDNELRKIKNKHTAY